MTIQTMTLALVLSLATPLVAYAEDTHPHVDCGKQNAQMSSMTAEEKAQMQAECAKQKQHMDCGKNGMDMSGMTAAQRENMQAQCKQMHDGKSGMHSSKDADAGRDAGKGAASDATPNANGAAKGNKNGAT